MRIKVDYYCDKIPAIYNNRFLALIKTAISKVDKSYQNALYNKEESKPFTYSVNLWNKKTEIEWVLFNKDVCLKERVFYLEDKKLSLYISSSDDKFMFNLINGLHQLEVFDFSTRDSFKINFQDVKLKLKNITVVNEKKPSTEMVFKTLAPFYFKDLEGKPVIFSDPNFKQIMNNTVNKQLRFYGLDIQEELEFENVSLKSIPVKHCVSGTLKTAKPIFYFSSSSGIFKLKGNKQILDCIYKNGFGARTSQGFGMLEAL